MFKYQFLPLVIRTCQFRAIYHTAKKLGVDLTGTGAFVQRVCVSKGFRYLVASRTSNRATTRLEQVFVDLLGPRSVVRKEGKLYTIVPRDGCSRYSWMYRLASKQDTPHALECFLADDRMDCSIKMMRSDNGPEFRGEFGAILDRKTIEREYILPGVGELDGVVESAMAMSSATRQTAREEAHVLFPDTDRPSDRIHCGARVWHGHTCI